MFQIHHKGNENMNRIQDLLEDPANILQCQVSRNEQLTKLILETYVLQKKKKKRFYS